MDVEIILWDGSPGTFELTNQHNFTVVQKLIDTINQLSQTNILFRMYDVKFDLRILPLLNRNARVQFLKNAKKLDRILPKLVNNILPLTGNIFYTYKRPTIPTVLYFDKILWDNYWQTVADDLGLVVDGVNKLLGTDTTTPPVVNNPPVEQKPVKPAPLPKQPPVSSTDTNKPVMVNPPTSSTDQDKPSIPSSTDFNCEIKSFDNDKALYRTGDTAKIEAVLSNDSDVYQNVSYTLTANTPTGSPINAVNVAYARLDPNGNTSIQLEFNIPDENDVGYLLTLSVFDSQGNLKDTKTNALDVSDSWTNVPRYGVLTNFDAGKQLNEDGVSSSVSLLNKYHINAAMYYDAYYRPQNTIPGDSYQTWIGRKVDKSVLQEGINLNHQYGQEALLYNMINATTGTPDDDDTAMTNSTLFGSTITRQDGTKGVASKMGVFRTGKCNVCSVPGTFDGLGEQATYNMLGSFNDRNDVDHKVQYYYNPESKDWQGYIGTIMKDSLDYLQFDGWQGDTIGDIYGVPYENRGTNTNGFHTQDTYADFINAVKLQYLANKTFGMNAVNYGGQDRINVSKADFNYAELWQSNEPTYNDLAWCIRETNSLSDKPLIVPAYMYHDWFDSGKSDLPQCFKDEAILIKDAIIFANGGSPMELANGKELPTEYYPDVEKNKIVMSDTLGNPDNGLLRQMYNFVTAYSNLIFRSKFTNQAISVSDSSGTQINSSNADCGKVYTFSKNNRDKDIDVLQMINLTDVSNNHWQINNANDENSKNINTISSLSVKFYTNKTGTLYEAIYDNGGTRNAINYTSGNDSKGRYIQFEVDKLGLWNMYYIN